MIKFVMVVLVIGDGVDSIVKIDGLGWLYEIVLIVLNWLRLYLYG